MKNYLIILVTACCALFSVSCEEVYTTYNGPDYIGFADTTLFCPVQENGNEYELKVAATTVKDYDRTFGVEVVSTGSNAIEGTHFTLPSNTFVIKAGETSSVIKVAGIFENFDVTDSLGVHLRLITAEEQKWEDLYPQSQDVKITFVKVCNLNRDAFTGWCVVSSAYLYQTSTSGVRNRLVRTEADPENENGIIVKDLFYDKDIYRDNYDLRIEMNTEDPLAPDIEIADGQIIGTTREVYGGPIGDSWIRVDKSQAAVSFYNTCQNFMILYHDTYVVDGGSIGTFLCVFDWITDAEAEVILRDGFPE